MIAYKKILCKFVQPPLTAIQSYGNILFASMTITSDEKHHLSDILNHLGEMLSGTGEALRAIGKAMKEEQKTYTPWDRPPAWGNRTHELGCSVKSLRPFRVKDEPASYAAHLFPDTLCLIGTPYKRRLQILINDHAAYVTETSFDLLLKFALALQKTQDGWVHKTELLLPDAHCQCISKLRQQLKPYTLSKSGEIIQNNHCHCYRLAVPKENITLNIETIKTFPNALWQEMVTEWVALSESLIFP